MLKNKKGITLVALIITIIVLLILAVVTIQEITGDGIITKAKNAAEKYELSQIQEEAQIVKDDAKIEYAISGKTLTQAELLSRLQKHFEGSTIEGNSLLVKNGKYKIVVDENTNISVEGNVPREYVKGDVKVTHTVTEEGSRYKINLTFELFGIPKYNSNELKALYLENEYLPNMTQDELLTMAGNIFYPGAGLSPETVYDGALKEKLDGMPYGEFKTNGDAKVQEKYGLPSATSFIKYTLIVTLTESEEATNNILSTGADVVYAKQLLPELVEKTEPEIINIVGEWAKNKQIDATIEEIVTELTQTETIEEYIQQLNQGKELGEANFFTREQAILNIALKFYNLIYTGVEVYLFPDNVLESVYCLNGYGAWECYVGTPGEYLIKVTGPNGNTEEIVVKVGASITLDKEEITTVGETTLTSNLFNLNESDLVWKSSDENIVSIEGTGVTVKVIVKTAGEATITATCGEYSATCAVSMKSNHSELIVPTITATGNFANNANISEVREGNIPIPTGYTYVKGDVDGGAVIKDSSGNEWVWVPATVSEISEVVNGKNVGKLYDFFSTGATAKSYPTTQNSGYREPDVVTGVSSGSDSTTGTNYDYKYLSTVLEGEYAKTQTAESFKAQLQDEFDNMIESVSLYGGYYIGRYEAGGSINSPVLQQGAAVIRNTGSSSNWYYMYTSAKKLAANESVTTGMIWGCQWDNTLKWLVSSNNLSWTDLTDSREWGNYYNSQGNANANSGTGREAGYSEYWKAGNIYDLAGNYWDWTLEANDSNDRVKRGGDYGGNGGLDPASGRIVNVPTNTFGNNTFRPTLIIE